MDTSKFDTLTARQLECLRLVSRDCDSSAISRILDIAPNTVDSHLKTAMAKLGTNSRFAAARALAELESRHHSLVTSPQVSDAAPPVGTDDVFYVHTDVEPDPVSVQESHTPFDVFGPVTEEAPASLPQGAFRNDLTKSKRLLLTAITVALMFLSAFAAAAMIYTVQGIIMAPKPTSSN